MDVAVIKCDFQRVMRECIKYKNRNQGQRSMDSHMLLICIDMRVLLLQFTCFNSEDKGQDFVSCLKEGKFIKSVTFYKIFY
jgi:hypothetical protein